MIVVNPFGTITLGLNKVRNSVRVSLARFSLQNRKPNTAPGESKGKHQMRHCKAVSSFVRCFHFCHIQLLQPKRFSTGLF